MGSLALDQLESLLKTRKLDGTLARHAVSGSGHAAGHWAAGWERRVASTGIDALDAALEGGWRRGEVSEIVGGRSTGRTTVLMAALAAATRRGELVGLVDALDRFDPVTAAAAGVDLDRLLWVRGAGVTVEMTRPPLREHAVRQAVRAFDLIVRAGGFSVAALDLADIPTLSVRALPYTTWMRLAHANEGRETACVLVGDGPMGRSARGATVRLEASAHWTGSSAQSRRLAGLDVRAQLTGTRDWAQGRGAIDLRTSGL